ncbi:hypothetical protein CSB37_01810 [bacterium DOLZORAL124_38_8]|nr:MAG: hypothetical protein CSB37_01810 [bacterium DOLZORAL124_38_8]
MRERERERENKHSRFSVLAFTLIELLVVVVIVGILAGMGIAQYKSYVNRAKDAKLMAELKMVQTALEAYFVDHETYKVKDSGYLGTGSGFLTFQTGNKYPISVTNKLKELKYLEINNPNIGENFKDTMIYTCNEGKSYHLYAKLHFPPANGTNSLSSIPGDKCGKSLAIRYGKSNYVLKGGKPLE